MKFSINDFFSTCDQFSEEIPNEILHFCAVTGNNLLNFKRELSIQDQHNHNDDNYIIKRHYRKVLS